MKKTLLFVSLLFAVMAINASEVITVNLADYTSSGANAADCSATLVDNELVVDYKIGAWGAGGVEFALPDIAKVDSVAFEFKGDAAATAWVSFFAFIADSQGNRFVNSAADLCISSWVTDWQAKNYLPEDELWTSTGVKINDNPATAIGFWANPSAETEASFIIRNVKVFYTAIGTTGLSTPDVKTASKKIVKDGQLLIIRDGVQYNVLGSVMK